MTPILDFVAARRKFKGEPPRDNRIFIGRDLAGALAAEGPAVIETVIHPYEPMMPPKVPAGLRGEFPQSARSDPGHRKIEANVTGKPMKSMIVAR